MLKDLLQSDDCAPKLKALADPDRLRIIQCLGLESLHVGDLAKKLGKDIAIISHHLGVLKEASLVTFKREGKFLRYSLTEKTSAQPDVLNLGCCKLDLHPPKNPAQQ